MSEPTVLHVGGASPYDVVIGNDLAERVPDLLGEGVERVALLFAGDLNDLARPILDALVARYDVLALGLPDGEAAKTASVANDCWEALGEAGFTRSDAVVTFGGGATTDLGGFVAASWLRGVKVVHVPTTVLAMVDAAVGGKTGINTGAGKNLVGAFHEPAGVLCDLSLLAGLPAEEIRAGLGEVIKCGFIADPVILDLVEKDPAAAQDPTSPTLRELITRSIQVKIDVVVEDLKETGGHDGHPGREALNYGHTLAHAIEKATDYRIRHGEAVSIGCVYVAEVARRAGSLAPGIADRHARLFGSVGLPTRFEAGDWDELHASMKIDKKSRGSRLRLVVLEDLGRPRILAGPDDELLRSAYDAISGSPA